MRHATKYQVKTNLCFVNNYTKPMWYVSVDNGLGYLHADGVARTETVDRKTSKYTGYFKTRAEARQAIATAKAHRLHLSNTVMCG